LANAIEVKDSFLRGHSEEVAHYVAAVAERLDLPPKRREELIFGSLLHDIGKIGISERILLKPTELAPEEFEVVKLHPRIGYKLVQQVPALHSIAPAILYHHERFDGGGYPSGLRGEDIPLEARIICVADSFSAMISSLSVRTASA
jgi:HD-GYP domain-containing protein (c-di-GMP phosphodiesterase class II)